MVIFSKQCRKSNTLTIIITCFLVWASANANNDKASAHIIAAEEALAEQRYKEAATEYRIAAGFSDNASVAATATRVGYSYGFNQDALKSARRWLKLDAESKEGLLYIAQIYLRIGKIRDSRRNFEKLLRLGDGPIDQQLLRLIPMLGRENPEYAYKLIGQLARPYGDSAYAHYAVGVIALDAGYNEVAKERAQEAIELNPDWVRPHLLYARSILVSGNEAEAIDYTARLIGDNPKPDPEARLELAIMLVSAGRDDDALSQVNQVLLEQPQRTDGLRLMAIINFRLNRLDAAKADFEDLLATGNYRTDAYYYLGRIAQRRTDLDDAISFYGQVRDGSTAVESQGRVAGILLQNGEVGKALEHLNRFAERNPVYAIDMLRVKAQVLVSLERYQEALQYFDRVAAYRPEDESSHLARAELLLRMGDVEEAIRQYRVAVKRWPDSAISLNALGYSLADLTDRFDEAERLIRRALNMQPDNAAIIDSWGWILYRRGKNEEALEYLQNAYQKLRDPEIAGHVIEVLWVMGRHGEAITTIDKAQILFPESKILDRLRERINAESTLQD